LAVGSWQYAQMIYANDKTLANRSSFMETSTVKNFRDLIVWQRGIKLAKEVYQLTSKFPQQEVFGITNQLRRASVSIPSNIAEGQGRQYRKEFVQFLYVAIGSVNELDTQFVIAEEIGYLSQSEVIPVLHEIGEIRKMLFGLIHSLK
jgi:four helix bundle protein